jgi:DNA-binding protein YbaB
MGLLIVASVGVLAAGVALINMSTKRTSTRIARRIVAEHEYVSPFDQTCIAMSFKTKEILLGRGEMIRTMPFSAIQKVDVVRNDSVVTTHDKASMAGRALVGGMLFGPLGALSGAVTSKRHSNSFIANISLKILASGNSYTVTFWANSNPRHTALSTSVLQDAERLHALVLNAMAQAEVEVETSRVTAGDLEGPRSEADELAKLWALKEGGALSLLEYEQAKKRLLSSDG